MKKIGLILVLMSLGSAFADQNSEKKSELTVQTDNTPVIEPKKETDHQYRIIAGLLLNGGIAITLGINAGLLVNDMIKLLNADKNYKGINDYRTVISQLLINAYISILALRNAVHSYQQLR